MRTCSNASSRAIRSPSLNPSNGRRAIRPAIAGRAVIITAFRLQHDKEISP